MTDMIYNRSVIDEVRVDQLAKTGATDDSGALIKISYQTGLSKSPLAPNDVHLISSDASADEVYVEIGFTGSTTTTTIDTSALTLQGLVDELNDIAGIKAVCIGDGSLSVAVADTTLLDIASTEIPFQEPLETLFVDFSADFKASIKIGVPEVQDSGRMRLLGIEGSATGVTNGTVTLSRDNGDGTLTKLAAYTLLAAQTAYLPAYASVAAAPVYRGPLVLTVASDDLSVCDFIVRTVNAEY